jgi:hypothetical protein
VVVDGPLRRGVFQSHYRLWVDAQDIDSCEAWNDPVTVAHSNIGFYREYVADEQAVKGAIYLAQQDVATVAAMLAGGGMDTFRADAAWRRYANPFCLPAGADLAAWGRDPDLAGCLGAAPAVAAAPFLGPRAGFDAPRDFVARVIDIPGRLPAPDPP